MARKLALFAIVCLSLLVISHCCSNHGTSAKKAARAADSVDPDEVRNTAQLIESRGYVCTEHTAFTDDGYYLGLFRIPNPGKPVVLLQHGLLDTSSSFVINSKSQSLGYILHDAGYDVFMCNNRGNRYSRKHEEYTTTARELDFNWDQFASSDLPACINNALQIASASQLYLIGHSEGATSAFAEFSRLPSTWVHKVKLFIALAPLVYLHHHESLLLRTMARLDKDNTLSSSFPGEFAFTPEKLAIFLGYECKSNSDLCDDILSSMFGKSGLLNKARMDVYNANWPDMTSRQNLMHWIKSARVGNFADINGTSYDISKMKVPTAVFCGSNDDLGGFQDCNKLVTELSNAKALVSQQFGSLSHMDYVWAESAADTVYPKIIQLLKQR